VLDYGCGWGRLLRLFYKFVPHDRLYGADPWDQSIQKCKECGIRGNLAVSDYVPRSLPFDVKFDLIFAFSVFTHLSEKTANVVQRTLRSYLTEDGMLAITIRPKEYWNIHDRGKLAHRMIPLHERTGYAFVPHNLPPIDGEVTYGDSSITLEYIRARWTGWSIDGVDWSLVDPYQLILFLRPCPERVPQQDVSTGEYQRAAGRFAALARVRARLARAVGAASAT
jgi:SAM-dependent methyltransferase